MRNYAEETEKRVKFIQQAIAEAHADGIIFGNSGGKDSALVGILCKMACENTEGVILPCSSKRNFTMDKDDGMEVANQFGIKTRLIDLTPQKELAMEAISPGGHPHPGGHRQHRPPAADDDPLRHRRQRKPPGGRHRQRQRVLHGLLHQVGGTGPMTSIPSPT